MAIQRPADARPVAAHEFRGFNGLIGHEVVAWRPGFVEMTLKVRPELCGVGAPLRNSDGTAAYAINASAPIYQISRDRLEADWGPRLVKIARDIRTGMAAQPSASTTPAAMRPATNGNGHRPPMSAMARR